MMHSSLINLLMDSAKRWPDKVYVEGSYALTYQQTLLSSITLAHVLKEQGISRWDRVAIIGSNCVESVVALYACNFLGAIATIINENSTQKSVARIQASMKATFVFTDKERSSLALCFDGVPNMLLNEVQYFCQGTNNTITDIGNFEPNSPVISTDPALMIYTSGSTGTPKGIVLSQDNVLFVSEKIQQRLDYQSTDTVGLFLPLSFDYGLYQLFLTAISGATLKIFDGSYTGPALAATLEKHQISVLPGVPHLYTMLTKFLKRRSKRLPNIRICSNTGAHLAQSEIEVLKNVLPNVSVFPMYGLTECKRVSILTPDEYERYPNSVGRALDDTEVFVVDDEENPLPVGEVGELVVCGRHLALGYWDAEEETALRYRKHPLGVGRALFTGDDFRIDEDGYLYYVGRRDEQIKRHGFRIHRLEIEDCALEIDGVKNACVLQTNDRLILVITLETNEMTHSEISRVILAEMASQLEPYKLPDAIEVFEELPVSANGKIDRKALQKQFDGSLSVKDSSLSVSSSNPKLEEA